MKVDWDTQLNVFDFSYSGDKSRLYVTDYRVQYFIFQKAIHDFSFSWEKKFKTTLERNNFLQGFLFGLNALRHIKGSEELAQFLDPSERKAE